jgi:hypothetical protein
MEHMSYLLQVHGIWFLGYDSHCCPSTKLKFVQYKNTNTMHARRCTLVFAKFHIMPKSGCVLPAFLLHYIELGWTANISEEEKMQFQTASSL